ncbi:MAG: 50S ribosomal protein L18 [Clostridia bacterium]|nr:50S ribosomal protein L18 [Clostridiales bacterium]
MLKKMVRNEARKKRHRVVRNKIHGSAERPRLNVYRSLNHIYAQLVDDDAGVTLLAVSTQDKEVKETVEKGYNLDAAKAVGKVVADRALQKGIKNIVFDRGGYKYHGRVKALADAARENGLNF